MTAYFSGIDDDSKMFDATTVIPDKHSCMVLSGSSFKHEIYKRSFCEAGAQVRVTAWVVTRSNLQLQHGISMET